MTRKRRAGLPAAGRGEPYPKSGDETPPVGFVGRMGGIGSLFEPPGARRRQKPPREHTNRRPIKTSLGFRA
ncbi:MAG: hypothetical protein RRA15_03110 [bacterium]|nr:hypothetical protein [bacterium]